MQFRWILILSIIMFSQSSDACRCEGLSPEEAFPLSKAVLIVKVEEVTSKKVTDTIFGTNGKIQLFEAKFNTIEVLKNQK